MKSQKTTKEQLYMFDIVLQGRTDDPDFIKEQIHELFEKSKLKSWKKNIEFEVMSSTEKDGD